MLFIKRKATPFFCIFLKTLIELFAGIIRQSHHSFCFLCTLFMMKRSCIPLEHFSVTDNKSVYKVFEDVKNQKFDGLIITGAPVENMPFENVNYWQELCDIMEWSKTNVTSTLHICWGAQAGLYYHYGIQKRPLEKKMFGIFPHTLDYKKSILFRGFDDVFYVPHSRHTTVAREDIEKIPELKILASSKEAGVYAVFTENGKQIFIMGHPEYNADTLKKEYERDVKAGLDIEVPKNYFLNDDPKNPPVVSWRAHANLLYSNWLNYFVYQTTPYDISEIQ